MLTYKTKQYLFVFIKVAALIAAPLFIYFRLRGDDSLGLTEFITLFKNSFLTQPLFPGIILLLSFLNWFFEIFKWKALVETIKPFSLAESTRQVLTAQSLALFTPFKIGEYGAKTMFFEHFLIKKVLFLNFLGNFSQLLATLFLGSFGLFYFVKISFPDYLPLFWGIAAVVLMSVLVQRKYPFFIQKRFSKKISRFLKNISAKRKVQIVGWAFLRYIAFSLQFYLLLNILYPAPLWETLLLIFTYYLISSALPVMQLLDLAVKGSVALLVFSPIPPLIILFVTLVMWLLNAVLPALMGLVTLFRLKTSPATVPA